MKPLIEVDNLNFSYGKTNVLREFTLKVNAGDIMCLMGRNGCGKTTLIDCILGFNHVDSSIKILGQELNSLSRIEIAKKISYVQQIALNDSMLEVYDYLLLGRIVHKKIYESVNETDVEIVEKVTKELGIDEWLQKNVNQLSGGEKQLVMIARALIQDTPIIIMDEPTSALDFGNQSIFLSLIKRLQESGKTVIFTTHNPNHALAIDASVCLIDNGRCIKSGKARECLDEETLHKVYGKGINFIRDNNVLACTFSV